MLGESFSTIKTGSDPLQSQKSIIWELGSIFVALESGNILIQSQPSSLPLAIKDNKQSQSCKQVQDVADATSVSRRQAFWTI